LYDDKKAITVIQQELTDERRSKRIDALAEESKSFTPLSNELGKFSVILADPPWSYDHTVSFPNLPSHTTHFFSYTIVVNRKFSYSLI